MSKTGSHKIRPAGRLVLTIGRDLIQDSYAAVVELVKNAYDADSQQNRPHSQTNSLYRTGGRTCDTNPLHLLGATL